MSQRKRALYFVTVRTPSRECQDIVEACGLHAAASAAVTRHCDADVDPETWTPGPGRAMSAARLLSLRFAQGAVQVTAEALSA
jgi:hypothetical protein